MLTRTSRKTVTFRHPFTLTNLDGPQPAGRYEVEMEEELIEGLSFPAYHRTLTIILLPGPPGGSVLVQAVTVNGDELDEAERRDAAARSYRPATTSLNHQVVPPTFRYSMRLAPGELPLQKSSIRTYSLKVVSPAR